MSRLLQPQRNKDLTTFRPMQPPRSLTHELVLRLTADIVGGKLAPGSKLPTEQEMIAATGVSRTVVREAVAHLRAEGLVLTRQGVGAFVAENPRKPFRIDIDQLKSLRDVIDVMELRTGVEIEAAGIAAERATPQQIAKIKANLERIDEAIERHESGVDQDFAFHTSIAEATGNPQFGRFLEYLGRFIIPRETIRGGPGVISPRAYSETLQKEHRQIVGAIEAHAVSEARAAMRRHLLNSRKRYRQLAADVDMEDGR